uniref:Uncharacterized protein n=1 Tax=Alexandrium monilatum TaxID=311494 RepID=A0A7S4VGJ9_9DINO|mmetsp:Transcript_24031/g.71866  ORF Transcript_24031/g.71866 Transcript_24031/m.71866 type:complete len:455 (+) Transcript_24031:55-1419(+)
MRRDVSRSRSPLLTAPSPEAREAVLAEFARVFWLAPDGPDLPPWIGDRAARVVRFRDRLVAQAEAAARELDLDPETGYSRLSRDTVVRWQSFTFYEDTARMSDVLFRGPIEPRHANDVEFRLHSAWRRFQATVLDFDDFGAAVRDFRVSAVRVAMMLETARPPEATQFDRHFELPDARTLASLLSLRCEKDDEEELLEMYRLVCQKLQGVSCAWCGKPFDESSTAGLFDGGETLTIPVSVPKLFVPQCGHPIHTLCFGSQLIPDGPCGLRGDCRRCGLAYSWTSIDFDPMINAFCLLFGGYVDKRAREMREAGEVAQSAVCSIAQVCQSFSQELGGLVSPSSAWLALVKRHSFAEPETVEIVGEMVLRLLLPPEPHEDEVVREQLCLNAANTAVIGPEDRSDGEGSMAGDQEQEKHLTEVFLPDETLLLPPAELADDGEDVRNLPAVPDDFSPL